MREQNKHIEALLQDYINDQLASSQHEEVTLHLQQCEACSKVYQEMLRLEDEFSVVKMQSPSQKLRREVFRMIEEEKKAGSNRSGKLVLLLSWQNMLRIAAAIALVMLGYWLGGRNSVAPSGSDGGEVAEMKQELSEIKEMLLVANLKAQYPSERIQAVNQVESYQQVDVKLVTALVNTLNTDESPNVRLAAANALQKFAMNDETVRAELVRSLEFQTEPIVQIALINMMVELEEKSAIHQLKTLLEKQETLPEVKKQAQLGIEVLI